MKVRIAKRFAAPVLLALLALLVAAAAPPAHAATTEQIHNDAGLVKFYRGEFASAVADFERAIGMNPNYAEAHYNLGRCLEKLGDPAGAIARFEEALRVRPTYSAARSSRDRAKKALDAQRKKEVVRAEKFRVAISPDLSIPFDDFSAAFYAYYENQSDRAREMYRRMERDDPASFVPAFEQGVIFHELKMYAEAIERFTAARDRAPGNVHAIYNLGLAHEKHGQVARAIELYREAASRNPAFTLAAERATRLSVTYARDRFDDARRAYERGDWKNAGSAIDEALALATPGTAEASEMRNLQSLVKMRLGDLDQKSANLREAFLARNRSYDEVAESGRVRYAGEAVTWTGVVYRIHERAGRTVLVVAYTTDRGVSSDALIGTGTCKAKFFQVHLGRKMDRDARLDEESFVEVQGRIRGPEELIDGYRLGCTAPIPGITAFKITATHPRASGTLVLGPLQ